MYPIVVIKQPNRKVLRLQVVEPIELGRECDGVLLADPQTSRRHARLAPRGRDVVVEDLGSTNGMFFEGARASSPVVLTVGSSVRIGDTTLELVAPPATRSTVSDEARGTMLAGAVRASGPRPAGSRETSIEAVARAVRDTTPLASEIDHEGTITIVFSDIESSTERSSAMGDAAWMKLLNEHNALIRRHLRRNGGREVKNQGDGFMLTFPSARRALQCMIAVQRDFMAEEASGRESVRVRVGVHTGEVIAEGGDIFGRHVNMAARVAGHAAGGEILVSALVREIASARGDLEFGEPRLVTLKGIEGEHLVYPVEWRQPPAE